MGDDNLLRECHYKPKILPFSPYKQRPRVIKTVLVLLYSAWKPEDVKQQNIKFLRKSIRWVTLLYIIVRLLHMQTFLGMSQINTTVHLEA